MQRKNHKPEIKWKVVEDNMVLDDTFLRTDSMTPLTIAQGTGRHDSIGGRVKFLRLSYEINIAVRRNNEFTGDMCLFRVAMIIPRVNDAGIADQVQEVLNNNSFWDYNTVNVKFDQTRALYNPQSGNSACQWHIKGMMKIPMNVQLNNQGGLMDDKDKVILCLHSNGVNMRYTVNFRCKTSFIDN